MAGFAPAKVKRKDLEEVYDEFSEFSLSSPARKIRRLDAELPPIMEEEEPTAALISGKPLPEEQVQDSSKQLAASELAHGESSLPSNGERALVLYKPVNAPLLNSPCPSNVFLSVDPDMIAGFKSRAFWRGQPKMVKTRDEEPEASAGNGQAALTSCLAVIPWMPSQLTRTASSVSVSGAWDGVMEEEMASDDANGASMDIEVEGGQADGVTTAGMIASEGLQHWQQQQQQQQQHCMTPHVGPSESAPVMWSWG